MNNLKRINKEDSVVSVADFLEQINASLLSQGGRVQGEVTSIKTNHPTTIFFTIKDSEKDALLNCIIWQSTYKQNSINVQVGDEVIVTGTPEIFPRYGNFSFKTQTIEYAGEGALKKAYEELRKKLTEEGLLAVGRKRELPKYPNKIGVITSRTGVVIQDFSSNLGRYGFKVDTIYSSVEGKNAIHEILASIKTFKKRDIEVLVIMRGGGSWESLQPFNTESVVRAITKFKCPVLTGIGHDVDVTLAELVADVGESTPTAVAEALNESWDTLVNSIESAQVNIMGTFHSSLSEASSTVESNSNNVFRSFQGSLSDSHKILNVKTTKVRRFFTGLEKKIYRANTALQSVIGGMKSSIREKKKYLQTTPLKIIKLSKDCISTAESLLSTVTIDIGSRQKNAIRTFVDKLDNIEKEIKLVNPERNLKLGYSLSYSGGKIVRSVKDVSVGDETETHLADGKFTSKINNIK
jgi:exodeoxyribonuclease VII large subunit